MIAPPAVPRRNRVASLVLRLILGAVFIFAGAVKLAAPQAFADGMAAYQIIPEAWTNVFALSVPPFELLLGAWLLLGWHLRSAAFCAALTLLVFLAAAVSANLRGLHIDCACFGSGASATDKPLTLVRDGVLAAGAVFLYVIAWRGTRSKEHL